MRKAVTILGSTGSIGASALRVARSFRDDFKIYGLSCKSNIELLEKQIEEFSPEVCAIESVDSAAVLALKKKHRSVEFLTGESGVLELASRPSDILLSAIVGAAGLKPSMAAIGPAKRIALANKETLVMAGDIFMDRVRNESTELIPVDSEHSAIFSLIENISVTNIYKVILTASGGSLRDVYIEDLDMVTPEEALNHPTWNMGNKITIDSATLMNKGLEVIEAHHLFGIPYDQIDIIIHPESVVHSMIETVDGSVYSHMGVADMALPILGAFKYPHKVKNSFGRLDLTAKGALHFSKYDEARYPALGLCYRAGREGGTMPAVLNAANEIAVSAFLDRKISFTDIAKIVAMAMDMHTTVGNPSLDEILKSDADTREFTKAIIKGEK